MTNNCRKEIKLPAQYQKTKVFSESKLLCALIECTENEGGRQVVSRELLNPNLRDPAFFETEDRRIKA